ncbi:menaquinone biosynthesis decarboxylase [Desulfatiglans anilini]|uniref:menaquinone biosynthesis decarboxylase n=1 Tax=Desulfatiglans anilini TaxID=90728 RepID=UPI0004044C4E|nr:menaquinone biosynthesis decarboxylase [Desulfatiglans anilini]
MFETLQKAIEAFEAQGELVRVKEPLSPHLEISEVTDRVVKKRGPALLFERPAGHGYPVLTNLFGSLKRVQAIFDIRSLDDLGRRFETLLNVRPPTGWIDKLKLLPRMKELGDIFPKTVKDAPCQEVVETEKCDLGALPVLTCWPEDGGPFITLPVVVTRDPASGRRNVGMYRMQVFDAKSTGMHWHLHKGGAAHYLQAARGSAPMPVAVALGPDPITTYSATAPLPDGIDEFMLAGFLRRKPVKLVRCVTCDLEVPAESQFVIEGFVRPGETRREGPFGDHTGFYSPADDYPVFHVTAITRRSNPIYTATVVGRPPMEDGLLGKVTERLFLPLIRQQMPEIVDMNLPVEGVFHNLCFVAIDKRYPGHAQKVMHALWGLGQMMFTKMIFVFDAEVDVQNVGEVLFRLGGNVDPGRDLTVVRGPVDALDHAAPLPNLGTKMGVDCTRKWSGEGYEREWPELIRMSDSVRTKIDQLWNRLKL